MDVRATNTTHEIQEFHGSLCFPQWALREMDRLMWERSQARTAEERFQAELQAAILQDTADRYGRHLVESAEL